MNEMTKWCTEDPVGQSRNHVHVSMRRCSWKRWHSVQFFSL